MATIEDSQQHDIKDLVSVEENISTTRESTPLLGNEGERTYARMFCCNRHPSKAAIIILLWNLILVSGLESFLDPSFFGIMIGTYDSFNMTIPSVIMYSMVGFLFLFCPLAGCLADIRWGRYKTVVYSVRIIWGSLLAMIVFGVVGAASIMIPMVLADKSSSRRLWLFTEHCPNCHHCSGQYTVWNTYFHCISVCTLWSYLFQY